MVDAFIVCVGKRSGACARIAPLVASCSSSIVASSRRNVVRTSAWSGIALLLHHCSTQNRSCRGAIRVSKHEEPASGQIESHRDRGTRDRDEIVPVLLRHVETAL